MVTSREALQQLIEGNRRYVSGDVSLKSFADSTSPGQRAGKQEPLAIILGCSDSRIPVEIIFDQGPGDLFVIRVAGNIVTPSQIGSIEFAARNFGTRLVVVLGHTHCGAIRATLDALESPPDASSPNIQFIVDHIRPPIDRLLKNDPTISSKELVRQATRANIHASIKHIQEGSPWIRRLILRDELQITGAEYSLETGSIEFLE